MTWHYSFLKLPLRQPTAAQQLWLTAVGCVKKLKQEDYNPEASLGYTLNWLESLLSGLGLGVEAGG